MPVLSPHGSSTRGRGRGRGKANNSSGGSSPVRDVNSIIVQRVSDLAAAVTNQATQMTTANENMNRLTEAMANLTENFSRGLQNLRPVVREDLDSSDDSSSDSDNSSGSEEATNPFAGLFENEPAGVGDAKDDQWESLLESTSKKR